MVLLQGGGLGGGGGGCVCWVDHVQGESTWEVLRDESKDSKRPPRCG